MVQASASEGWPQKAEKHNFYIFLQNKRAPKKLASCVTLKWVKNAHRKKKEKERNTPGTRVGPVFLDRRLAVKKQKKNPKIRFY